MKTDDTKTQPFLSIMQKHWENGVEDGLMPRMILFAVSSRDLAKTLTAFHAEGLEHQIADIDVSDDGKLWSAMVYMDLEDARRVVYADDAQVEDGHYNFIVEPGIYLDETDCMKQIADEREPAEAIPQGTA